MHTVESWPFFAACTLIALASAIWTGPRARTVRARLLLIGVVCLGAGWYTLRIHERPRHALRPHTAGEPLPVRVRGVVIEPARADPAPSAALGRFFRVEPTVAFTIGLTESWTGEDAQPDRAGGRLRVRVPTRRADADADWTPPRPGELVEIDGLFQPVRPAMNPGEPDRRAWAAQDGLIGVLRVPNADLIRSLEPQEMRTIDRALAPIRRGVSGVRAFARASLDGGLPDPLSSQAVDSTEIGRASGAETGIALGGAQLADSRILQGRALLGAMLLGARDEHLPQITDAFTRLGLTHLVAISGFNMVLLSGLVLLGVRLTGDHGAWESVIACSVIAIYLVVLPVEAPSLRGGLMVMAFIASEAGGRRYDRLTVLGWLAFALALLQPLDAFSPGYQLTFGVVAALLVLAPRTHGRLFGIEVLGIQRRTMPVGRSVEARAERLGMRLRGGAWSLWSGFKLAAASALTAWAIATPVVVYHTGLFTTLAPITTLIIGPLCSLYIGTGYVVMLLGALWPGEPGGVIAGTLGVALDAMGIGLVWIVHTLDAVPGATFRLPPISAALAGALAALAAWWLWRGRLRDPLTLGMSAACAIWLAAEVMPSRSLPERTPLRIDMLAVGDGTCVLLRSADRAALWDCGSLHPGVGTRTIPDALRALGVTRLDTVFITHANLDHFAALADVASVVPVGRIITTDAFMRAVSDGAAPGAPEWQHAAAAFHTHMSASGLNVRFETVAAGQEMQFGHARMHVLWPDERVIEDLRSPARGIDPNDFSLVVRLDVAVTPQDPLGGSATRSLLLTGDAARLALPALLAEHPPSGARHALRAEVIELPHHGSFVEAAVELLRRTEASVVLQSTGPRRASDRRWRDAASAYFSGDPPERSGRTWLATAHRGWIAVEIGRDGGIRFSTRTSR